MNDKHYHDLIAFRLEQERSAIINMIDHQGDPMSTSYVPRPGHVIQMHSQSTNMLVQHVTDAHVFGVRDDTPGVGLVWARNAGVISRVPPTLPNMWLTVDPELSSPRVVMHTTAESAKNTPRRCRIVLVFQDENDVLNIQDVSR